MIKNDVPISVSVKGCIDQMDAIVPGFRLAMESAGSATTPQDQVRIFMEVWTALRVFQLRTEKFVEAMTDKATIEGIIKTLDGFASGINESLHWEVPMSEFQGPVKLEN